MTNSVELATCRVIAHRGRWTCCEYWRGMLALKKDGSVGRALTLLQYINYSWLVVTFSRRRQVLYGLQPLQSRDIFVNEDKTSDSSSSSSNNNNNNKLVYLFQDKF